MSAPQKRLRPTTYSHRQALARMRKQPGLVMHNTGTTTEYRYQGEEYQFKNTEGVWLGTDGMFLSQEKAARWFDAIPQPK